MANTTLRGQRTASGSAQRLDSDETLEVLEQYRPDMKRVGRWSVMFGPKSRYVLAAMLLWPLPEFARGQNPGDPSAPAPAAPATITNAELLEEIRRLRSEVVQVKELRDEVRSLRGQIDELRSKPGTEIAPTADASANPAGAQVVEGSPFVFEDIRFVEPPPAVAPFSAPATAPVANRSGAPAARVTTTHSGASTTETVYGDPDHPANDNFPLNVRYRYNFGTGALGGGGYTQVGDEDGEFTVNLTNQITLDGTFYDRQNMPTIEQGFNVPFARTFLYGNITKNWIYQVGTQGFLGQFNLLDVFGAYRFGDALTLRFGKGLTPPLYEYYAFSPAMETVITNSPLFQLAGKRQMGIMALGNLFDGRLQYWSGINNSGTSWWYDINRNVEFNGALTLTPFAQSDSIFSSLGGGVGFSAGNDLYRLDPGQQIAFVNGAGEPTTNSEFVTSTGIPFFTYNEGVIADGLRTRIAPHVFWYGRFSVLAEYMNFSRELADANARGRSTQNGYYVNLSYYLTGERDFQGNGFQGYSTTAPLRPFRPSRGQFGPGAWQIASQWAQLNAGTSDFRLGFADPAKSTNLLDQMMIGINWWPNRYTRMSFNYIWTGLNRPIPINGPDPIDTWGTFWFRYAMFF
ncbi:porin [bacterium]|nr:porin [bacterium]